MAKKAYYKHGSRYSSLSLTSILIKMGLFLVLILTYKTVTFTSKQPTVTVLTDDHVDSYSSLSEEQLALRLGGSIKFETVSFAEEYKNDYNQFLLLHKYLEETFPKAFHHLKVEKIAEYSLLMRWDGQDSSLLPVMFTAHLDVVPIANPDKWTYPAFSGAVKDGYIWGRGTMDDKLVVTALLEVVEDLLVNNYHPQRTIYLAFGHDEETGGFVGAQAISKLLLARGVKLEYILDEGLPILLPPAFPGINRPIATIGVAEKGAMNIHLSVDAPPGHSSMPPSQTAIGILAAAIAKIESNPMATQLEQARLLFDYVGREATLPMKIVFANNWLFEPIVSRILSKTPSLDALQRTTTAVTMFNGGNKPNVLPSSANATINFRVSPSNTLDQVIQHIKSTINDDRIQLRFTDAIDPAPVTSPESKPFKLIQSTVIQEYSSDIIVTPAVMIANTDTKWYWDLTTNIFRFCPQFLEKPDLQRFHGMDERISTHNYKKLVDFYYHLIRNGDKKLL